MLAIFVLIKCGKYVLILLISLLIYVNWDYYFTKRAAGMKMKVNDLCLFDGDL